MTTTQDNVVVTSRVRLARNYHDLPFSNTDHLAQAKTCVARAMDALTSGKEAPYRLNMLSTMGVRRQMALVEKHLISRDLLQNTQAGADRKSTRLNSSH